MELNGSFDRGGRVVLVSGAAGYGKTAAVRRRLRGKAALWLAGEEAASLIRMNGHGRAGSGTTARALVIDEPAVSCGELVRWISTLTVSASPPASQLFVIARRLPPPGAAGSPAKGRSTGLGPADLTLSPAGVAKILSEENGGADPADAERLHRWTQGWPALVRLAAPGIGAGYVTETELYDLLSAPGGAVTDFLTAEVLSGLEPTERRIAEIAAHIGAVDAGLAAALDVPDGGQAVTALSRLGLLTPSPLGPVRHRIVPAVGAVVRQHWPWAAAELHRRRRSAAAWYESVGAHGAAARCRLDADEPEAAVRILADHGSAVLVREGAAVVIGLVERVPESRRTRQLSLIYGEALIMAGNTEAGVRQYSALSGDTPELDAAVARRLGYVHYRAGDPQEALRVYARGRAGEEQNADEAILLALTSVAHWAAGDGAQTGVFAELALHAATACGDYRALMLAHTALGFAAEVRGEPAEEQRHYDIALELAEANGDAAAAATARNNRASRMLGEGRLAEALAEAERAIRLADAVGHRAILTMALCNVGAALQYLGRLDEALERFERAVAVEHRVGSAWLAWPPTG
jgi:ATP/maltotriose-dependent transcriptional regulator MalT